MIFFNICYVPVTVLVLCVYYVAVVWLLSLTQLCEGMDCSLPGYLCLWGFSRQEYWSG